MPRVHSPAFLLPILALLGSSASLHARSGAAPTGNAGAPPDFMTCARHHTAPAGPVETTSVSLSTSMGMPVLNDDEYAPGATVDLVLGVTNTSGTTDDWGFSLTVLAGTVDAGSLTAGPGTRLDGAAGGQTYLTHSPKIAGPSPGGVSWAFSWTAGVGEGDAIFYICANAAGQPNGTGGDWIGCDTVRLVEGVAAPMDTDGDGIEDLDEAILMTNPLDVDTDDDGISDGDELIAMTDPLECDSDGDGLSDGLELGVDVPIPDAGGPLMLLGTDLTVGCFVPDTDTMSVTDPNLADTDGDDLMIVGCGDGDEDANGNGAVDGDETDPTDPTDCPPVMAVTARLQLIRDLGAPPASPQAFFNTMPCMNSGADFKLCEEAGGLHESFDDPMTGLSISGDGVFVCIEYDSDLSTGLTMDTIRVSKDPAMAGNLLIEF